MGKREADAFLDGFEKAMSIMGQVVENKTDYRRLIRANDFEE